MIYRVVIIDNKDNEVTLAEKDGVRGMTGSGAIKFDFDILNEALEKLIEAYQGGDEE